MTNLCQILISLENIIIPAVISFVISTTQMMDFDKVVSHQMAFLTGHVSHEWTI